MKNKYYISALEKLAKKVMHQANVFFTDPQLKHSDTKHVVEVINPKDGTVIGEVSKYQLEDYAAKLQQEAESWKTDSFTPQFIAWDKDAGYATFSGNTFVQYSPTIRSYYRKKEPKSILDLYAIPPECKHRTAAIERDREEAIKQSQQSYASAKAIAPPLTYGLDEAFAKLAKNPPMAAGDSPQLVVGNQSLIDSYKKLLVETHPFGCSCYACHPGYETYIVDSPEPILSPDPNIAHDGSSVELKHIDDILNDANSGEEIP